MQVLDKPAPQDTEDDDLGILHVACPCDDGATALCGTDVSAAEWGDEDTEEETECVVCAELAHLPCPKCGAIR